MLKGHRYHSQNSSLNLEQEIQAAVKPGFFCEACCEHLNNQMWKNNDVLDAEKLLKFPFLVKRKQYDQLRIALFTRLSCNEIDQNKICFMLTHSCKQYLSIAFVLFFTFSQYNHTSVVAC